MKERAPTLLSSTAYNFVAQNSAAIFGALSSIVVARHLGAARLDAVSYAMWLQGLLVLFATLGIPGAVTRHVAEHLGRGDGGGARTVARRLGAIGILSMVTVVALFAVEERWLGGLDSAGYSAVVVALAASSGLQSLLVATLLGMRKTRPLALQGVIVYPMQLIGLLALVAADVGEHGVLWLYAAGNVLGVVILLAGLAGTSAGEPKAMTTGPTVAPAWRRVFDYAVVLSGITLIDAVVWQRSEVFFLKKFAPPTSVGFYSLAFGLSQLMVRTVGTALLGVLMPFFASLHGAGDDGSVRRLFAHSTRWLAFFTLPLVAAGTALGGDVVQLLYGDPYRPIATVLPYLLISAAAGTIAGGGAALLYGVERQGVILRIGAATAVFNIGLDFTLIPRHHLLGAAWANATAQTVAAVVGLGYIVRAMGFAFPWRGLAISALSAGGAWATMIAAKGVFPGWSGVVVAVVLGPIAFLVSQRGLGFYEPSDRETIASLGNRAGLGRLSELLLGEPRA